MEIVTLQGRGWSLPIDVSKFKYGFANDWYRDHGAASGEHVLPIDDSGSYIRDHWSQVMDLVRWEEEATPLIFSRDERELRSRLTGVLKPVYYADVSLIANTLGTTSDRWYLYCILDERVSPEERYRHNLTVGNEVDSALYEEQEVLHLGDQLDKVRDRLVERVPEQKSTIQAYTLGMKHNAFLCMIVDGSSNLVVDERVVRAPMNNRYMANGLHDRIHDTALGGLNWYYILWQDLLILLDKLGIAQRVLPNTVKWLCGIAVPLQKIDADFTMFGYKRVLTVLEWAVPMLYWRLMDSAPDNTHPIDLGFYHLILPDPMWGNTVSYQVYFLPHYIHEFIITARALRRDKRKESGATVQDEDVPLIVDDMVKWLGWFAIDKLHRVLSNYAAEGRLVPFFQLLTEQLEPKRPLIERMKRVPLHEVAMNDEHGMLMTSLPFYRK